MRYARIDEYEIVNGHQGGMTLYIQGCDMKPHCPGCFNPETWSFDDGELWTEEVKQDFFELAKRSYIKRITLLGGDALAEQNLDDVLDLVNEFRLSFPEKTIWLYSGYIWESIWSTVCFDDLRENINKGKRQQIISQCDVMVDGRYIDEQRDLSLAYRGSRNQRVINIQETLKKGKIVLWSN